MAIRNDLLEQILSKISSGSIPDDVLRGGWAAYFNGDQTPITFPAGVETKVTCDSSLPANRDEQWLPIGVSSVWNSTTSQFDFTSLSVGDMVDIRLDGTLTTTTVNDSFVVNFIGSIGSPSEFTLPLSSGNRFLPGTSLASRFNGVYIGSLDIINNPAEIRVIASDDASGFLNDMYIKVLRRAGGV